MTAANTNSQPLSVTSAPTSTPRILWLGDAAVSTGFARATHAVCDYLHANDWDVHVLGINYYGDPHPHPYPIYPAYQPFDSGTDPYGVSRLAPIAQRIQPDLIVILNDPWNIYPYTSTYDAHVDNLRGVSESLNDAADRLAATPIIGWLAVDANNQKGEPLNRLSRVVTWTRHAVDQLEKGGYYGPTSIVPLGVDHTRFTPHDKSASRQEVFTNLPPDAFVFGAIGRNQPRKRLDLTIEYFAEFLRRTGASDAYLYLHVAPTGEKGFDLKSLAAYHEIRGRVLAHEVRADKGVSDSLMPKIYSALDVLVTTTQGEGWGLPVLESAACSRPSIVPNWSALSEWPTAGVVKVPCTATAITAPLNNNPYTVGGVPDKVRFVDAMVDLYENRGYCQSLGQEARQMSNSYTWAKTGRDMAGILAREVAAKSD